MKEAHEIKAPMNVTVVSTGGNLRAFARMGGVSIGSIDVMQKKAKTTRYFNMSTRDLDKTSQSNGELYDIKVASNGLAILTNGVLLANKAGVIVGSVGISDGSVDEDESVAKVGTMALSDR